MPQDDPASIEQPVKENDVLKQQIAALEEKIAFLTTHPALARGMRGGHLIAKLTGGALADYAAKYDVQKGKIKIEVKSSKLNHPDLGSSTRRWNWSKPNGWKDKGKNYDFLLLIGDKDTRFLDQYPNDSCPYVFFLIPCVKVHTILTKGKTIGANIQIISNLKKAKSPASVALKQYLRSEKLIIEIEAAVFSE
jgi:hypothetical protein